jgi:hypothetical protein
VIVTLGTASAGTGLARAASHPAAAFLHPATPRRARSEPDLAMAGRNVQQEGSFAGYFGLQLLLPPRSASTP